ncbi:MAG TPA: thioredoxin-like domain-containing protein, partial [Tahibacter sp.]|nr:thioredoxin-like domain-containing protein [Tahibacter sp.]
GKVVLVDFWTYGCSNCLATLPHVKRWYAQYKDHGFVVVGVHSPEFDVEKDPRNVRTQVRRLGIEYPVAQDNDLATFETWAVKVWPTSYLVDRDGNIVLRHVGEGHYDAMDAKIRELLGL